MMVDSWFLLAAFYGGVFFGILLISILAMAKEEGGGKG